jgi:hypothetical protein
MRRARTPPGSLAYAALTFNRDLGFDGRVYSLGTALFYASFMLCMVRPAWRAAWPPCPPASGRVSQQGWAVGPPRFAR